MSPVPGFPSLRARRLRTLLQRELGYEVVRQKGSHRQMRAPGLQPITFAFSDGDAIGAVMVRRILLSTGISEEKAREVASRA